MYENASCHENESDWAQLLEQVQIFWCGVLLEFINNFCFYCHLTLHSNNISGFQYTSKCIYSNWILEYFRRDVTSWDLVHSAFNSIVICLKSVLGRNETIEIRYCAEELKLIAFECVYCSYWGWKMVCNFITELHRVLTVLHTIISIHPKAINTIGYLYLNVH